MSLITSLKEAIDSSGYLPIDRMMKLCMFDHSDSYYQFGNPFGEKGDFLTSPTISQLFSESLCIWCINIWQQLNSPTRIKLVELGPGNGVLIQNILRIAKKFPEFYAALEIVLVEISSKLQEVQKQAIKNYETKITWLKSIDLLETDCPTMVIANEFFDALPIKQYIKKLSGWRERVVQFCSTNQTFYFSEINTSKMIHSSLMSFKNTICGSIIELSHQTSEIIEKICNLLLKNTGAALIIDYGYCINPNERSIFQYNSTLQAVKRHKYVEILKNLGQADLSAHVDFYTISEKVRHCGAKIHGPVSQKKLLHNLGIHHRLRLLQKYANSVKLCKNLEAQYIRLTDPSYMGELFKAIAITSDNKITPIGFTFEDKL